MNSVPKLLPHEILDELVRLEERFREATRIELSEYNAETLLYESECGYEKWTGGFSVMNVTKKITREEAVKILYGQNTETLQDPNNSKGVHIMSKLLSRDISKKILRLEESFREAVRSELLEYNTETLMREVQLKPETWSRVFTFANVMSLITHDEAIKFLNSRHKRFL